MTAHISYMFYSFFLSFALFLSPSEWFLVHHLPPAPPLLLAFHRVNQLAAEALPALACQIETLLCLARGLLPSPSANTGLDSYHVSSHYQQSRAPGRQWEESGQGMERRGREERPSITLWPPGPLAATPLKHSPTRLRWRRKSATPRWGSGQTRQRNGWMRRKNCMWCCWWRRATEEETANGRIFRKEQEKQRGRPSGVFTIIRCRFSSVLTQHRIDCCLYMYS